MSYYSVSSTAGLVSVPRSHSAQQRFLPSSSPSSCELYGRVGASTRFAAPHWSMKENILFNSWLNLREGPKTPHFFFQLADCSCAFQEKLQKKNMSSVSLLSTVSSCFIRLCSRSRACAVEFHKHVMTFITMTEFIHFQKNSGFKTFSDSGPPGWLSSPQLKWFCLWYETLIWKEILVCVHYGIFYVWYLSRKLKK